MDYEKELSKKQYESEVYKIGYANAVSSVLGLMQRGLDKGYSLDDVIDQVFEKNKNIYGEIELERKSSIINGRSSGRK